jgi:tetratricopeptide (TPR) repeat protein
MKAHPPLATALLLAVTLATLPVLTFGQAPGVADAIRQLQAGDAFRALLTLNEVVGQTGLDAQTLARAHAVRAMAYLEMNQPERARAAVDLALKANPGFVPSAADVNSATSALFESAKAPATANPEAAGQAAEQAGQFQQAFLSYLSAYQALPNPAPMNDDRRLRERIITIVQKLGTAPIVPREAIDHARKADQLIEAEAILGGTAGAGSQSAATELRLAVRSAPWWPDAAFKLAQVSQKLQRVDEALLNLTLYRLADPSGYAASVNKTTAAPAATTPAAATPATVPVPAGTATIHFYRASNYIGSSRRAKIACNGQPMAELQSGRIVSFKAPAGTVTLKLHKDEFPLEVAAGATYYFKVSLNFDARAVPPEEAAAEVKGKRANDMKRISSSECKPAGAAVPRR